jgi:SAM-dependent methyltransferase
MPICAQANFTFAQARRAVREFGRISSAAPGMLIARLSAQFRRKRDFSLEHVAAALYRGILDREPDPGGLAEKIGLLRFGTPLEHVVRMFITSPEFNARFVQMIVPLTPLPDLRISFPDKYETQLVRGGPMTVYVARTDADIALMASLIERHRFYDQPGVWSSTIDWDKKITAAIARGLGADSCFDLGCFTGPVMSVLADAGVTVLGTEVSHLALAFAYPNIRASIIFGDLLTSNIDRQFDVVLCMDVLEHISPLRLDRYIEKILGILDPDGFIYFNSPMWGDDDMFTPLEEPYLEEWLTIGNASYWRHWPCDDKGWPIHGHLVWGSPAWWEAKFAAYGLIRDRTVERIIHRRLASFLENKPGRRTLFVLHRCESRKSSAAVAAKLDRMLSSRRTLRG